MDDSEIDNDQLEMNTNSGVGDGNEMSAPRNEEIKSARNKKRRWLWICLAVLVAVFLAGGGFLLGSLAKWQIEDKRPNDDANAAVPTESLVSGGIIVPADNIVTSSEDDKLILSFLKMHNDKENFCYSPLSIRYALEMLSIGADGETKAQIDALLGDIPAKRYNNVPDHLSLLNSLWIKDAWQDNIKQSYVQALKTDYGATLKVDSFSLAANINQWVKDGSFGLIDKTMSDEEVRSLTTAALVNILAIDMEWEKQFMKEFTKGELFANDQYLSEIEHYDSTEYTTMRMWGGGSSIYYNLAADATVLAMDLKEYEGTKLQFVAFKPDDLQSFIENVTVSDLNQLIEGMVVALPANETYLYSFDAYIPKFKIQSGLDSLREDLQELGVVDAFDLEKANFAKLTDDKFAINSAAHKTTFDFSEEGIKAAAVTMLGGMGAGGGPTVVPSSLSIEVSINGPFLYIVRDKESGDVWFTGTVYEPNRWEDDKALYKYQ